MSNLHFSSRLLIIMDDPLEKPVVPESPLVDLSTIFQPQDFPSTLENTISSDFPTINVVTTTASATNNSNPIDKNDDATFTTQISSCVQSTPLCNTLRGFAPPPPDVTVTRPQLNFDSLDSSAVHIFSESNILHDF